LAETITHPALQRGLSAIAEHLVYYILPLRATSEYPLKIGYFAPTMRPVDSKFQVEGVAPISMLLLKK